VHKVHKCTRKRRPVIKMHARTHTKGGGGSKSVLGVGLGWVRAPTLLPLCSHSASHSASTLLLLCSHSASTLLLLCSHSASTLLPLCFYSAHLTTPFIKSMAPRHFLRLFVS
jgi:hypothetical protein